MQQHNWLAMRDAIVTAVDAGHDGVLVLHGTDSLAYSAAALSFLLLGLPVPVLLTGSMLPAGAADSDAWPNLCGALRLFEQGLEDGVQLYFHGQLVHGCRATKLRSEAFDAFVALPRHRDSQRAAAIPAELDYRQPRQPVNLAVVPVFPGCRPAICRPCWAAACRACCWSAMAVVPGRRMTWRCSRYCAQRASAVCCWRQSANALKARWYSIPMRQATDCVARAWSVAAA